MGGVGFSDYAEGTDPKQVFKGLVDRALYENGHGGYSGSIAEKDGFTILSSQPMTLAEAEAVERAEYAKDESPAHDKWGPACAIPIFNPEVGAGPERFLALKFETINYTGQPYELAIAEAEKRRKRDEYVKTVTSVVDDRSYRVEVEATKGKAVTKYYAGQHGPFDTQAQARAELVRRMKLATPALYVANDDYTVMAKVVREDGKDLVVARYVPKKRVITAEVTYATRVATKSDKPWGWYFFGIASC